MIRFRSVARIAGLLALPSFLALASLPVTAQQSSSGATVTAQEAYEIGVEVYVYFYPLVTMDVTRRQLTNIEVGEMPGRGPDEYASKSSHNDRSLRASA